MQSHELARMLLDLPDVEIKISSNDSQRVHSTTGILCISETEDCRSVVGEAIFCNSDIQLQGEQYIELFAT